MIIFAIILILVLFVLYFQQAGDLRRLIKELQLLRLRFDKLDQSVNARITVLEKKSIEQTLSKTAAEQPNTILSAIMADEEKDVATATPPQPAVVTPPIAKPATTQPHYYVASKPAKSRTSEEWESFIGGKLLNRIGAIAIVLAAVFFLKYAMDNNWISPWVRILIGLATGATLIGFAERNRNRGLAIFAQGLLAAGIAIEYFTVYAAHDFYDLIPTGIEFIGLCGVTIVALFFAVLFDSVAVVYLAWAGGFLTPFILHLHSTSPVGSFIYLIIFSGSLLILTRQKPQRWKLEIFSKAGVYFGYLILYDHTFEQSTRTLFVVFAIIAWAMYHINDVFRNPEREQPDMVTRHIMQGLNALFILLAVFQLLYPEDRAFAGIVYFIVAVGYAFSAVFISPAADEKNQLWLRNAIGTILFITAALLIFFEGYTAIVLVTVEAALLFGWCARYSLKTISISALFILVIAFFKYCIHDNAFEWNPISDFVFLFNVRTLILLIMAAAMAAMLWIHKKSGATLPSEVITFIAIGLGVIFFIWITIETHDSFEKNIALIGSITADYTWWKNIEQLALSGVWLAFSMVAMGLGLWKRVRGLRIAAIAVFGITILKIFILDLSFLTTFYRMLSFLGLGVILLLVSYLYGKFKYLILPVEEPGTDSETNA